ncbi:hypothetical protein AB837_00447 [bacterium AB1]|nr:hypothetical protein AB837_00447 [bacterium AB1]
MQENDQKVAEFCFYIKPEKKDKCIHEKTIEDLINNSPITCNVQPCIECFGESISHIRNYSQMEEYAYILTLDIKRLKNKQEQYGCNFIKMKTLSEVINLQNSLHYSEAHQYKALTSCPNYYTFLSIEYKTKLIEVLLQHIEKMKPEVTNL